MLFNTPIQPDNAFCRLNWHRLESTISCYSKPGDLLLLSVKRRSCPSPDQLPKYCHQSPPLTAPGASQSFHPPPTKSKVGAYFSNGHNKCQNSAAALLSYPLIEPKASHNYCHVLHYISRKSIFGAPSSPPPRRSAKALPSFPPGARYGRQSSPPPSDVAMVVVSGFSCCKN